MYNWLNKNGVQIYIKLFLYNNYLKKESRQ